MHSLVPHGIAALYSIHLHHAPLFELDPIIVPSHKSNVRMLRIAQSVRAEFITDRE